MRSFNQPTTIQARGVNNIPTLQENIDRISAEVEDLREQARAQAEEAASAASGAGVTTLTDPAVLNAAKALIEAVAKAQGHNLPLQAVDGSQGLPILTVPPEMLAGAAQVAQNGGVGLAVMVAPPTAAARG